MAEGQQSPVQEPQTPQQQHEQNVQQAASDANGGEIKTYTAKEIGGGKHERYVDFDRFQDAVEKSKALEGRVMSSEQKYSAMEQRFEAMRKALVGEKAEGADTTDEFNEMLKVGPKAYFEKLQAAALQQFEVKTEVRSTLEKFRSLPNYSQDLEKSVGEFIQENGLQNLGASKALAIAYRAVTGKNMGEGEGEGYSTRKAKESLGRPGSGAGKPMGKIDLKNMSLEEFRKNEKEIYAKVMAQAQGE